MVDASVWIGSLVPEDAHYVASKRWIEERLRVGDELIGPDLLLIEIGGGVSRRIGDPALARVVIPDLVGQRQLRFLWIGPVLSLAEVAYYLRVHPSTIYRLVKRTALPAFKVGTDWRFDVEALDEWRFGQDNHTPKKK